MRIIHHNIQQLISMKTFVILISFIFTSCGLIDRSWSQHYINNSDVKMNFYLHYYKDGNVTYPSYEELQSKPFFLIIEAHKEGWWASWPTNFDYGTLGHMYVFSPDTLAKYSWEDVLAKKKYWFTARPCQFEPIHFPEDYEYMGDI